VKSVIFFHRSVGRNLIKDGGIYQLVKESSAFTLSDYDQNTDLLTSPNGQQKPGFVFPGGNTRPADFAGIFSETTSVQYELIRDMALRYDTIVIKSCYPNSNIKSDEELDIIKGQYQAICNFFAKQKDKKLIILTSPPLRPIMTKHDNAKRARQLANWLSNLTFASNINVFNFFDQLAIPEDDKHANTLKPEYRRRLPFDSHPNARASIEIAPKFVAFLEN